MASQNQPQDPVTEEKETPLVLIDPRLILPGLGDTMKDYLYSQRMQQNSVTSALVKQIQQDSELGPKIAENERDNLEPFIRKRAKLTKRLLALGTGERSAARRRRIRRLKAIASARTTSTNPPASQQTSAAVPPTYANLPDAVLVAMLDQPYDEAWMITYHVSNNLLEGWTSGKKFDSLVNHGALKVGDKIYYAVGAQREYVAKILGAADGTPSRTNNQTDLRITIGGVRQHDLQGCSGPTHIIREFRALDSNGTDNIPEGKRTAWRDLRVRRGTNQLGTVHAVRQAYHLWEAEMDRWSARNNHPWRQRRAAKPRDH